MKLKAMIYFFIYYFKNNQIYLIKNVCIAYKYFFAL